MKKEILLIFFLISFRFNEVLSDQVVCELIEISNWGYGNWKTCFMDKTTEINSADTTITSPSDDKIQGVSFYKNKKIKFLPMRADEQFPNLLILHAGFCSLTTISKVNFKGLSKLQFLSLHSNQIQKINSDTFEELVSLEYLYLFGNKLQFINGRTFVKLTKLRSVNLSSNKCIDESFSKAARIAVLGKTLDKKCSFEEELLFKEDFGIFNNVTLKFIESKISGVVDKLIETEQNIMSEFKTSHNFTNAVEKALEVQAKIHLNREQHLSDIIKQQTAEIVDVNKKLAQAESQIMLKIVENEKLFEDLQRKNEEIKEMKEKIKILVAKFELYENNV